MGDLENIFIEGKPLSEALVDNERDEKSHEIEAVRKAAEKNPKRNIVYVSDRIKTDSRRVATRVKRWRDDEIRRGYGIMAKPFDTQAENIIWAMVNKGPVDTGQIGLEIDWAGTKSSLSAAVSNVYTALGPKGAGVLTRRKKGMSFFYQKTAGIDMSAEAVIDQYKRHRSRPEKPKPVDNPGPSSIKKLELPQQQPALDAVLAASPVVLEVKVSGTIDVVFKLG